MTVFSIGMAYVTFTRDSAGRTYGRTTPVIDWVFPIPIEIWRIDSGQRKECTEARHFGAALRGSAEEQSKLHRAARRDRGSVLRALNARIPVAIAALLAEFAVARTPACGATTGSPAWGMQVLADSGVGPVAVGAEHVEAGGGDE